MERKLTLRLRKQNLILASLCCLLSAAQAVVVTYYRFEVDLDPNESLLESPNEVDGAPSIFSSNARLDSSANPGSLPNTVVPLTGLPNHSSLDNFARPGQSGDPDLNAWAPYSALLDLDELTAEMWVRSEEETGVLVARSSSSNVLDGISDGFRVYDPSSLAVDFYTADANGVATLRTIRTSFGLDDLSGVRGDGNAAWRHVAFQYSMVEGVGRLYLDGSIVGSAAGQAGDALYWGDPDDAENRLLQLGVAMDGYDFSKTADDNGYVDELRISAGVLGEEELLTNNNLVPVPESGVFSIVIGMCALMFIAVRSRNR